MALSSTPTLIEINAELNQTNTSLLGCISIVDKLGIWDSQLDFANFINTPIFVTPTSSLVSTGVVGYALCIVTSSASWTLTSILPPWIYLVNVQGDGNNNTVYANIDPPASDLRYAVLTFTDNFGSTAEYTLIQDSIAGASDITVYPTVLTFGNPSESADVVITTQYGGTWSVSSITSDYLITVNPMTGVSGASATVFAEHTLGVYTSYVVFSLDADPTKQAVLTINKPG